MNITDPIRRHAQLKPEATAVIRPDGSSVSYGELDRVIDAVARRILELGLRPGSTAGLPLLRPYVFITVALALARLGIARGPMSMPAARMDLCLAVPGTPAVTDARMVPLDAIRPERLPVAAESAPVPSHQDGGAICGIYPTSGTIGSSKHVAITHELMFRKIAARNRALPLPADPRHLCAVGLAHIYGFESVLAILHAGGLVVLPKIRITGEEIAALIRHHRVNYLLVPTGLLERLVTALPPDTGPLPSLELVKAGGSLLTKQLGEMARRRLCGNIVSDYGATEAGMIAWAPVAALEDRPGAVGYIAPGMEVQAVDENDIPLAEGTEGVLRVRSDTCVDAYLDDPAASARAFRQGWFYPGDSGGVAADGLLTITGRTDEFINSGGVKASPYQIEEVLLAFEGVREAAAFGAPDRLGVDKIWAAVVPSGTLDVAALMTHCNERLAEKAPRFIVQLKELPRNDLGKVLRRRLSDMVVARSQERSEAASRASAP